MQVAKIIGALADGQVDRAGGTRGERHGDDLSALTGDHQGPVAALDPQVLDIRTDSFAHPQPVECQQRDQRMLARRSEAGRDQQRAELVAIQPGGVRLVIQPRTAHVRGR